MEFWGLRNHKRVTGERGARFLAPQQILRSSIGEAMAGPAHICGLTGLPSVSCSSSP
jgi:hypothetical protein